MFGVNTLHLSVNNTQLRRKVNRCSSNAIQYRLLHEYGYQSLVKNYLKERWFRLQNIDWVSIKCA